jgi:cytochrome c oxidase assembly protein subunit 11
VTTENGNSGLQQTVARRHRTVAVACAAIVLAMVGLSYAAVPLYRLYCQVTGYAGTTQRAEKASDKVLDRTLTVRFDANVAADLPWRFEPQQQRLDVRIGENALAFYKATNTSDRPVTGTAVFNVTPEAAGVHFVKVQCFCFTEQRLEPGQSVDMAVSFFVEPAFVEDEDTKGLSELTLSYTFYAAGEPRRKLGQTAASATGGGG